MQTIIEELIESTATGQAAFLGLRGRVHQGKQELLVVGLDNGNDALKGAVFAADGRLVTIRVPTAYREAMEVRGGQHEVTYTIGSTTFWSGDSALDHEGDSLVIGPTYQRMVDPRMRHFLAAGLVELLRQAGYTAGGYQLAVGFAIPNDELVPTVTETGQEEVLGVREETRTVLINHLKGADWSVLRSDRDGTVEQWQIQIGLLLPQAQTVGTLLAYTRAKNGRHATDLEGVTVLDIGGGDLQRIECSLRPYQLITRRLGDGTIRVARALQAKFPAFGLNDVAAQRALIEQQMMVAGRTRSIEAAVTEVLASQGQAIIADLLPSLRQSRRFVIITGGGVLLLQTLIIERLALETKVYGRDYTIVPAPFASVLNAIAALFAMLFATGRR